MVFLALYDAGDFGLFPHSRIAQAFSAPAMKEIEIVRLDLQKIPSRKRIEVIRENIDRTDFIAMGVGTYTFMHSWAHFAGIYGFTKNRPMLAASEVPLHTGWEVEMTEGPNPFSRVQWRIHGREIGLYSLDNVFEVIWTLKRTTPRNSVHYRLEGEVGFVEEVAPMYRWDPTSVNRNLFKWIERSLWLAGL